MSYQLITPEEFAAYVAQRGYRVEPIAKSWDTRGDPTKLAGYTLVGPRRNRKVVMMDPNGKLPLFDAKLWCDGVDYSTSKMRVRRQG